MPSIDTVISTIKAEMARRDMNQKVLAEAIGLSGAAVSEKLAGKARLTVSDLIKIADVLDVPASLLLGEVPERQSA